MEMLLTGRPIDAERAARFGLVNRIVERDQLLPIARELATDIESAAPLSVQAVKAIVTATEELSVEGWIRRPARRQHPRVPRRDHVGRREGGATGVCREARPRVARPVSSVLTVRNDDSTLFAGLVEACELFGGEL